MRLNRGAGYTLRSLYGVWRDISLSVRILVGLAGGVFIGLFFGDSAAILQPVGDVYIRLMQMTVLPYLITSLVIAFGQLQPGEAGRLALRGGALLLLVWLLTCLVLVLFPVTFPDFTSASFYSQAMIEQQPAVSFTDIYFTANPFDSLSRNVVPAIVLFSCLIGIGLMGLEDKEQLLAPLRTWNAAIVRVTHYVIALTPLGVLALSAVMAGTITPEKWQRLEIYFLVFGSAALLLAVWILPMLVCAVTPFRYREVMNIARDALLTAFVAGSAFIVLPILVDRCKELLAQHGKLDESADSAAEVLIPVMFNFPNAGKLLTLLFVPFAAWLSGNALPANDYPTLLAAGIPSYFAKAQMALPFLFDLFGLPQDLFQLYIPTTIVTGKFDSLVTAVNLLVFALVGAAAMGGFLEIRLSRILRAAAAITGGTVLTVFALRLILGAVADTSYQMDAAVRSMHLMEHHPDTIIHRSVPEPDRSTANDRSALQRIWQHGALRIGYDPKNLPMSFFNREDQLVGFDIELAEDLAAALGVRAEFIPVSWPDLPAMLKQGVIDIMPGVWYRPFWISKLQLTEPYFTGTVALAVRDKHRENFQSVDALRQSSGLTIGVPLDSTQLLNSMAYYFGDAEVHFEVLEFWNEFFEGQRSDIDAFLMPAEQAAAWTLLYPHYTVVVPQPDPVRLPSAFAIALGSHDLRRVINEWITFAVSAGLIQGRYNYWVLGKGAEVEKPRWSILHNVILSRGAGK